MAMVTRAILVALVAGFCDGSCPVLRSNGGSVRLASPPRSHWWLRDSKPSTAPSGGSTCKKGGKQTEVDPQDYFAALQNIDFEEVKKDLDALYTSTDQDAYWPADYGHYGPFFVRLAWHCAGSYRESDGLGGCDGGRQRFDPERSWDDNTNLDKARRLLWPIKQKWGIGLSWGDLFILAGTHAIESMGGPVLGFCAGRVDDLNGDWSQELGPTPQQEANMPCPVNGKCQSPLGASTVGLIYLNPEGPMGVPIPEESAGEVRNTFGRMSMNDSETVSLIGGGHAFGKTHGACPLGAGPSPKEDPANPWPGLCDTFASSPKGKLQNTFTSGFEGPWTPQPTRFDNMYFKFLDGFEWEKHKGPGGHWQWRVANDTSPTGPSPNPNETSTRQAVMMLTSDISLTRDPANKYQPIVKTFADDLEAFENAFQHSWYKLTTRDMGPVTRCYGSLTPPAQPFQFPLPPAPEDLSDFEDVADSIRDSLLSSTTNQGLLVALAYRCAATFRISDYRGGCNGARILLEEESSWPVNANLSAAKALLAPVKAQYGAGLSWSDLIVLAGTVAVEDALDMEEDSLPFCGGRTDTTDDAGSKGLEPVESPWNYTQSEAAFNRNIYALRKQITMHGLSPSEGTALHALHALASVDPGAGPSVRSVGDLSNEFFVNLVSLDWQPHTGKEGQYKARTEALYMRHADMLLNYDAELYNIARRFAFDKDAFSSSFASAWTSLMNADRFDGPVNSVCASQASHTPSASKTAANTTTVALGSTVGVLVLAIAAIAIALFLRKGSTDTSERSDRRSHHSINSATMASAPLVTSGGVAPTYGGTDRSGEGRGPPPPLKEFPDDLRGTS